MKSLIAIITVSMIASGLVYFQTMESTVATPEQYVSTMPVFQAWSTQFRKSYATPAEKQHRLKVFFQNLQKIQSDNKRFQHTSGLTKFSDLTKEEFLIKHTGLKYDPTVVSTNKVYNPKQVGAEPRSVDWRPLMVPVKNQGSCGSCWSFGAVAGLEFGYNVAYGNVVKPLRSAASKSSGSSSTPSGSASSSGSSGSSGSSSTDNKVSFSEQQLVDCARIKYGNFGCNGGLHDNAYRYMAAMGMMTEEAYPYTAKDGKCQYDASQIVMQPNSMYYFIDIPQEDPVALQNAVSERVLSVGLDATNLQNYFHGVIVDDPSTSINHSVAIVGYGHDQKQNVDYWLVRNSWGPDWGEEGYFRVLKDLKAKGVGMLGIRMMASFPHIETA